jgi:hypothetical protein
MLQPVVRLPSELVENQPMAEPAALRRWKVDTVKKVEIIERKLGRERALGQAWDDLVEIDPRQCSKEYLDTAIHELLHVAQPELSESKVVRVSRLISSKLWKLGFRRIHK